jgi:hypothetical protein
MVTNSMLTAEETTLAASWRAAFASAEVPTAHSRELVMK